MEQIKQYSKWLQQFADGTISEADAAAFRAGFQQLSAAEQAALVAEYDTVWPSHAEQRAYSAARLVELEERIRQWEGSAATEMKRPESFIPSIWMRYAAMVVLLLGAGIYGWWQYSSKPAMTNPTKQQLTLDIAPGKEGAILTLADGTQVVVDSLGDGLVAAQNGANVVLEKGRIAYAVSGHATAETAYNTMSTPKGRQFQMTLPDGTRVWLNAASSIQYPTVFSGKAREVTITGEVYLEVAKNASRPFVVHSNNKARVEVLGTAFNINAYDNETGMYITLIEGAISVAVGDSKPFILQPGQQALKSRGEQVPTTISLVQDVAIDKVMAWKNGLFNFDGLTLGEIMRQIERWYDIQVLYEKNVVPNKQLAGEMSRDVPLQGLLKNLEKLGLRYRINGKVVTVLQ